MRPIVLALSILGVVLFAGAFAVSFVDSLLVERAAREVVRLEVERRVGERIDDLSDSRIAALGRRALGRAQVDIESTQKALREDMPGKVANVVADMLNADCECRKRLVEYARQSEADRLSLLNQVRGRLVVFIESTYASVSRSLMREFRVFTGSNAIAFALLGVVTLMRRNANLQLALPAVVLVGAVSLTGGLYLFNQNWLHTVVFGEYVGFAYTGYLAGVALLLADVAFNRARMTTRMVNVVLQSVGAAAHALPC